MSKRTDGMVAALAALALCLAPAAGWAQERNRAMEEGITVQGTGEVQVKPDIARLTLGVQTQGADSTAAAAQNADLTQKVIAAIRGAGVAERDIRTSNYSIHPVYDHRPRPLGQENQPPRIMGYQVNNSVGVTVRKIADVGKVIDAAVKAGANVAGGIMFDLDDPTKAKEEALRKAVADASRKAQTIADAAKPVLPIVPNIKLVSISEGTFDFPRPMMDMAFRGAAEAAPTPIQPGEQTIRAIVTARFSFR